MFLTLLFVCIGSAVLGSYYPAKEIQKHQIAVVLRGVSI